MMQHVRHIIVALIFAVIGTAAAAQSQYRVQPGDNLSIEVLEDSSLNRSIVVLPDGRINFPFAGSIIAGGRSATQIQASISQAIAPNFATTPTVFVTVNPAASNFDDADETIDIYFLGEVNNPGITQVIIHCGIDNAELSAITSSSGLRDSDRRTFIDPDVLKLIESENVEITTWKKLTELQRK